MRTLLLALTLLLAAPVVTAPPAVAASGSASFDLTAPKAGWSGEASWRRQGTRLAWAGTLAAPGCQTDKEAVAVFRVKPADGSARLVEVMRTCDTASDTGTIRPRQRLAWARPLLYVCAAGDAVPCGKPKDGGPTIRNP